MGINYSKICGERKDQDIEVNFNKEDSDLEKAKEIPREDTTLIHNGQNSELDRKLHIKELDDMLFSLGEPISENDFMSQIPGKFNELEESIGKFYPTESEDNKYNNVIEKGPILLKDGSIYKGSWGLDGQKKGFGILIYPNGHVHQGYWSEDKLNGRGRFVSEAGDYFEGKILFYLGNFVNGLANGYGKLVTQSMQYEGEFIDDLQHGMGREFNLGDIYEGYFMYGCKQGAGKITWKDGSFYEGDFKNSLIAGRGKSRWSDGRSYSGEWAQNKMNGSGVFMWPKGIRYEGEYYNEKKEGNGTYYWDTNRYYKGGWINNKQHGEGIFYLNGMTYKVHYRFGKLILKTAENAEQKTKMNQDELDNVILNSVPLLESRPSQKHLMELEVHNAQEEKKTTEI
jgi:hypothetical protein